MGHWAKLVGNIRHHNEVVEDVLVFSVSILNIVSTLGHAGILYVLWNI